MNLLHNLAATLVVASLVSPALAQSVVNPPPGIGPAEPYRILLVTSQARSAASSDISVYDTFVQNQVAADPVLAAINTGWRALASTDAVDARDHTDTSWTASSPGVPIFRPDGVRIAADYEHLWSTSSTSLLDATAWGPLNGMAPTLNRVWTGTSTDGTASGRGLGNASGRSWTGDPESRTSGWVHANQFGNSSPFPLYAISDVMIYYDAQHPEGLAPGEQYRILFISDSVRDATSNQFADYDAFITADAMMSPTTANLSTTWTAVVSTPSGSAPEHTGTTFTASNPGVPVVRPDGLRIADSYEALWRTKSLGKLQHRPNITPSLQTTSQYRVWTGTLPSGKADPTYSLGAPGGTSWTGDPAGLNFTWIKANTYPQTQRRPIYGISEVLTVPQASQQVVRRGSPPNGGGFTLAPVGPAIGTTWSPSIDHTLFVPGATLDVAVFASLPANIPVPGLGTVLIDQVLASISNPPNMPFAVPIANNSALVSAQLSVQAVSLDQSSQPHLTNAIDILIGTY